MRHKIGDIWKEDSKWKVQLPNGVHTVMTKREALLWAATVL